MYLLLKVVIFQPVMLVYQRVPFWSNVHSRKSFPGPRKNGLKCIFPPTLNIFESSFFVKHIHSQPHPHLPTTSNFHASLLTNNLDPQQCGDWKPKGRSRWFSWWIPAMSRLFQTKVAHNNDEEGQFEKNSMDYKCKHEKMTNILCVCILYVFACSLTTHMTNSWNLFKDDCWTWWRPVLSTLCEKIQRAESRN